MISAAGPLWPFIRHVCIANMVEDTAAAVAQAGFWVLRAGEVESMAGILRTLVEPPIPLQLSPAQTFF